MAIAIGADEKKKLYVLGGFLAAVIIVGAIVFIPRGDGSEEGSTTDAKGTPTPSTTAKMPAAGAAPAPAAAPASTAAGGVSAASLVSVSAFRSDPFQQFEKPPLPPEPRARARRTAGSGGFSPSYMDYGPVTILPPDQIESSSSGQGEASDGGLPPMDVSTGREPVLSKEATIAWPEVDIPSASPAPVMPKTTGAQGSSGITTSSDKRLSGVIIGDSVRAMLVMPDGKTRIVQPGDEVDGISILRIERVTEGGRPVTRVIIREGGQESAVVLKANTRPRTPAPAGARPGG